MIYREIILKEIAGTLTFSNCKGNCWAFHMSPTMLFTKINFSLNTLNSDIYNKFTKILALPHTDEMLESEKSSLAGRVHDLERRVLQQQDEIVCLRSTLADVLRRLNLIEGNIDRGSATSLNILGGRNSAPNTPSRNGTPLFGRSK